MVVGDLNFPDTPMGSAASRKMSIINKGNTVIDISGISLPNGFYGTETSFLRIGATNTVEIVFKPTETKLYSGSIIVNSDAASGEVVLPVSGRGIPVANPVISEAIATATGLLILNWPVSSVGYQLESSPTVGPAAIWNPFTNGISVTNNLFSVSIHPDRDQSYFRLRKD